MIDYLWLMIVINDWLFVLSFQSIIELDKVDSTTRAATRSFTTADGAHSEENLSQGL